MWSAEQVKNDTYMNVVLDCVFFAFSLSTGLALLGALHASAKALFDTDAGLAAGSWIAFMIVATFAYCFCWAMKLLITWAESQEEDVCC